MPLMQGPVLHMYSVLLVKGLPVPVWMQTSILSASVPQPPGPLFTSAHDEVVQATRRSQGDGKVTYPGVGDGKTDRGQWACTKVVWAVYRYVKRTLEGAVVLNGHRTIACGEAITRLSKERGCHCKDEEQ